MDDLYGFVSGPAVWAAFIICVGGLILRLTYLYGLSRERGRGLCSHMELKRALRSIADRLAAPWSASLRAQPVVAAAVCLFHVLLLAVPLFLCAHNTLWHEAFGYSLPSLSDSTADYMTIAFAVSALFLLLRRIVGRQARTPTQPWGGFLLVLSAAPFVTGFLARHQVGPYMPMLILHMLSAELLMISIPFSKPGGAVLSFLSRALFGFEAQRRDGPC